MKTSSNDEGPRCERGPLPKHNDIPIQEYFETEDLARKMFPSWDPWALQRIIRDIQVMAAPEQVIPGVLDSIYVVIPDAGILQVHFDGTGGVKIDPSSDCTSKILDLARALKLVLGNKFSVGRPEKEGRNG